MKTPIVIGLAGKMRSGKDTVKELLENKKRGCFYSAAYGDQLKKQYAEIAGRPLGGKKDRKGLQTYGQAERAKNPTVWIDALQKRIQPYLDNGFNVVITDVRQANEVQHIRSLGGFMIKVHADENVRIQRMLDKGDSFNMEDLYHETELYVDEVQADFTLTNNGGLAELINQVDDMLLQIKAELV
jgi:dephospho-CoA kinase